MQGLGRLAKGADEGARDLGNVGLMAIVEFEEEVVNAAVGLVEGEPVETEPVGDGPVPELEGDTPLGLKEFLVGDGGLPAAVPIFGPFFGQIEFAVEESLEGGSEQPEVDGDDAVVDLAEPTAPLSGDAWGLSPFLG